MHASMQAQGVPSSSPQPEDAEHAQIPFLAILPDMSLHVALLEKDAFSDTAPVATSTSMTVNAVDAPHGLSTALPSMPESRFTPTWNPLTHSSAPSEPQFSATVEAIGGPSTTLESTTVSIPNAAEPPASQPVTRTISSRLRQFGLTALPSLRRAEFADIPESVVWTIAVVDGAAAGLLAPSRSFSRRFASGRSHSLRRLNSGHSLTRGASLRSGSLPRGV